MTDESCEVISFLIKTGDLKTAHYRNDTRVGIICRKDGIGQIIVRTIDDRLNRKIDTMRLKVDPVLTSVGVVFKCHIVEGMWQVDISSCDKLTGDPVECQISLEAMFL